MTTRENLSRPEGAAPAGAGVVVGPDDPRYAELVRGDNYRFVGSPDRVHLVTTADEVVHALQRAVDEGLRVAVRSGGHCGEDFVASPEVRVVIDLSLLAEIEHDPARRAIAIGAGATVGHVYKTLYRRWGVTVPAGVCTAVGMGGHVTGGGYGPLSRQHGLVADHLYAVEVVHVDHDGRVRRVVATCEPDDPHRDLWWAHTGAGGGNFGIVTRFWMRSPGAHDHEPGTLLPRAPHSLHVAMVSWAWDDVDERSFAAIVDNFLRWHAAHSGPDTTHAGLFASLWVRHRTCGGLTLFAQTDGTASDAAAQLASFIEAMAAGTATEPFVLTHWMPWLTAVRYMGQADSGPVLGMRNKTKAAYLRSAHSPEQLATLYRWFTREDYFAIESVMMLNSYGGAINRREPHETAAVQRDSIVKASYSATWPGADDDPAHLAWLRGLYGELYADSGGVPAPGPDLDGSYINYPDVDLADDELNRSGVPWHGLYFGANYPALQRVKARWDPRDVFRHPLSIRLPGGTVPYSTEHIPDRYDFPDMYRGDGDTEPVQPWDIGRPQPAVVAAAEAGLVSGEVLDVGCGLGDNAVYLASRGARVTAIDIAEPAVAEGRRRAAARGVEVEFLVADATRLEGFEDRFDTIVDSACFHSVSVDDRSSYLSRLFRMSRPGGRLHLFAFAAELEAPFPGPHRMSADELRTVLDPWWEVSSVTASAFSSSLTPADVEAMIAAEYPGTDRAAGSPPGLALDSEGRATMPVWHVVAQRRTTPTR
jgi:2-polyprenyl-3-methyl-5-hydroxy-6-metoxy-1,4-benzoquinol methylase